MEVFEAIFQRHAVEKLRPDPVPREVIEQMLAAAVQAPNHFKARPWHFMVLTGAARQRLGDCMAESLRNRSADLTPDALAVALETERARPLRAPLLIVAAVNPPQGPREIEVENICAAAAAVQNLLLAAHALGLGVKWRTGGPSYDPAVKAFLGLSPDQHLIGFLYIGYPEKESAAPVRPSFEDRTIWFDS